MKRSKALVIVTRQLTHWCPYKGQMQTLALCYMRAQDIEERSFCYGCDVVEKLKERFGLRTFRRQIVLSRCKHCDEAASLHEPQEPHRCTRNANCPGFEPTEDEGKVFVPTNLQCTEWMVVDVVTGERKPYADVKARWAGYLEGRRLHLPLVGAPGTVPADSLDDQRIEAAAEAARRRGAGPSNLDDEGNPIAVKVQRQKKTRRSK